MLTNPFYHSCCTGVSDAETFSCHTRNISLTGGCSIESHITDDDIALCIIACFLGSFQDQLTTGQTLAEIVVAVSCQVKRKTCGDERAEALSSCSLTLNGNGILSQTVMMGSGDLCTDQRTEGSVDIGNFNRCHHLLAVLDGTSNGFFLVHQLLVLLAVQLKIKGTLGFVGTVESSFTQDLIQTDPTLDTGQSFLLLKQIGSSYQLLYRAYAQTGHVFPKFLCDKPHEVLNIFRLSGEALTKLRVLGCHTYRTGVHIADSHHHTAQGYQGSGGKTKLLCSKDGSDGNIASAHQLTVSLDNDPVSQTVAQQRLMSFCQSKLPGKSCIVDGT